MEWLYGKLQEKRELKRRRTQIPEVPTHILQASYLVNKYALSNAMTNEESGTFKVHFSNMLTILSKYFIEGKKDYGVLAGTKPEDLEYLRRTMKTTFELMEKNIKPTNSRDKIELPFIYKMFYGVEDGQVVEIRNMDWRFPYGFARKKVEIDQNKDPLAVSLYKNDIKLLGFSKTVPKDGEVVKGKFVLKPMPTEKKKIKDVHVKEALDKDVIRTLRKLKEKVVKKEKKKLRK